MMVVLHFDFFRLKIYPLETIFILFCRVIFYLITVSLKKYPTDIKIATQKIVRKNSNQPFPSVGGELVSKVLRFKFPSSMPVIMK